MGKEKKENDVFDPKSHVINYPHHYNLKSRLRSIISFKKIKKTE